MALAGLPGACCAPPPPGKFFAREESPSETLKGFVYAIDTHQWDYAYESLTAASREEVGRLRFEVVIRTASVPVPHGEGEIEVPLYDLISNAVNPRRGQKGATEYGDRALKRVFTKARDSQGNILGMEVDLHFLREDGEWKFDFLGTVRRSLQGGA